jgi:hypothetical protein
MTPTPMRSNRAQVLSYGGCPVITWGMTRVCLVEVLVANTPELLTGLRDMRGKQVITAPRMDKGPIALQTADTTTSQDRDTHIFPPPGRRT